MAEMEGGEVMGSSSGGGGMSGMFPEEALEHVLSFLETAKDRNAASAVSKVWHRAEAFTRRRVFIGNCYAVSPEMVVRRFPKIESVVLKGKPRFSDFNLIPPRWGADLSQWILPFCSPFSSLRELRLKRMNVRDASLCLISQSLPHFRALTLATCEGFSTDGLLYIAKYCRKLEELDIQESDLNDKGGYWLSGFPQSAVSLVVLNFSCVKSEVDFQALERLVARSPNLRTLKVNRAVSVEELLILLKKAPQLIELGTGSFSKHLPTDKYEELKIAMSNCKNLKGLFGVWEASPEYIPILQSVCSNLTVMNLSYARLNSSDLATMTFATSHLQKLWVLDTVEDKGLESVALYCKGLKELRVFPFDPYGYNRHGATEKGFLAISHGCPNLRYILYFCKRMTNVAVSTMARNCSSMTHFRLCIMNPCQPDYMTNEPMDEGFGAVVKSCKELRRLSVSGLLTDKTFEYIGEYAKNLETLSVAFAGGSDKGMESVLKGCTKLRKLEIRDSPYGNAAFLSGLDRYESMRSLWMSACKVTVPACVHLSNQKPMLNVEVIKENEDIVDDAEKVYVYRSVAGKRKDAPDFVYQI